MKVTIYSGIGDRPEVSVEGSNADAPKDVAKAYKEASKELVNEKEEA